MSIWQYIIYVLVPSGIIGGIVTYFSNKRLEDYRFLQLQRQKAEIIARFFSKWTKYQAQEKDFLDKKDLIDYYEELNRMSLELSLWVPDKKILEDIMLRLENKESSEDIRTLIVKIRKMILGDKKGNFKSEKIVLWGNKIKELVNLDKKSDQDT